MAGEARLQWKITRRLRSKGWLVIKVVLTSRPGWPDLEAIRKGRTIRIEVKDERELDPLQLFRHQEIQAHGGEVYKVGTWAEFMALNLD